MTDEIVSFESEHVKVTPYSIEFGLGTTWEEARQVGIQLLRNHDRIQFYLGDWILFCTSISGWGKQYEEALEKTDYPYQSLLNIVAVARKFPPAKREIYCQQYKLSFTRFQEVVNCTDEQIEYLFRRADEENWSCARLREEVQKLKSPAKRLERWWVNLTDPMRKAAILATPHIDKKVKGKKVYILTGMADLPELPDSKPEGGVT